MPERCDLSLIIACYNEEAFLKESLHRVIEILDILKITYEIIFVEDKSVDRTKDVINEIIDEYRDLKTKAIFHSKNEGRGKAVSDGFRAAAGDVVGYIDIDLEVSPDYIAKCFLETKNNCDVVVGYRIYKFFLSSWYRYILSTCYPKIVSFLYNAPIMDTESGYKFFKRDKLIPLLDEVTDNHWFWDTEVMIRAYYKGFKIAQVPVLFQRRFDKKSTVRLFRDTIYYLGKLVKLRKELKKENN